MENTNRENNMENIVEEIVAMEWAQFQNTSNIGGRASCQDDWEEFHTMRKAQFNAWSEELLASYHDDLARAKEEGRNLLTEKYAYMMKSTMPERFAYLAPELPPISEEKQALVDEIAAIQTQWSVEFALKYPHVAGRGRAIHADTDTAYATSVETYTKGEMLTYSTPTLRVYRDYMKQLLAEGKNMVYEIRNNTVKTMGYADVAAAEAEMVYRFE